nr:MAG TPA: hypothetical protein [Caudoviricetes sp.]
MLVRLKPSCMRLQRGVKFPLRLHLNRRKL